jgi:small-conductance mechanosensitive channel
MPGPVTTDEKVEQLKQDTTIQKALEQTAGPQQKLELEQKIPTKKTQKIFLGSYLLLLLFLSGFYYLLRLRLFALAEPYVPFAQRLLVGAMAMVTVAGTAKAIDVYLIRRVEDSASQYNIRRIVNLIAALVIAFIVVSILFANWYTAVVSVGLLSLILGFALQTPITSFIAWIYILVRTPYRVG